MVFNVTLTQVGAGVNIDLAIEHWIDFGNMTESCLVQPDTCGPEGAAVALWVKLLDCPSQRGIITAQTAGKSGFQIICLNTEIK